MIALIPVPFAPAFIDSGRASQVRLFARSLTRSFLPPVSRSFARMSARSQTPSFFPPANRSYGCSSAAGFILWIHPSHLCAPIFLIRAILSEFFPEFSSESNFVPGGTGDPKAALHRFFL